MVIYHDNLWILPKGFKGDVYDIIYNPDGSKANLTGYTVKLKFKNPSTGVVTSITAEAVDLPNGSVKYSFIDGTNTSLVPTDDIDCQANVELSQGVTILDYSDKFIIRVVDVTA